MKDEPQDLEGLSGVTRLQLSRVPVRMREQSVTLAAWRMETASAQGNGVVVLVELPSGLQAFRGEGTWLGSSQERLAAVWAALSAPPPGEPDFELPRLG